jgi:hypothetical protein|tara:strand:+ start:286 stop:564 length:279 start_codon:yes stop_codon:yes gene_type:complete
MPQKRHTAEEIIQHLRTVEIERVRGANLEQVTSKIGVTPTTLTRWKVEFGGLRVDRAKRFKQFEQENTRFRKIVSDQPLDILISKEVSKGNF